MTDQVATMPSFNEVFGIDPSAPYDELVLATGIILEEYNRAVEHKIGRMTALNIAGGSAECQIAMDELYAAEKALEEVRVRRDAALCHVADMFGDNKESFMTKVDALLSKE